MKIKGSTSQVSALLYIEDNPSDFELFSRTAASAKLPIQIFGAADATEALTLLSQHSRVPAPNAILTNQHGLAGARPSGGIPAPNAILLDLDLPGITGFQFLERLRAEPGGKYIPVLAFTACEDSRALASLAELGIVAVFHKPTAYKDWKESVLRICDWVISFSPIPLPVERHRLPRAA